MTTQTFDQAKAEEFGGQVMGTLIGAATAYLISIGQRTGLFDTMATLPPSTSEEIARATDLNERYVREWLGGMTAARVMEHDGGSLTYWLPPEHAACLTRAAGLGNLAQMSQYFALLGMVEDKVVEAFRNGGGVPYADFPAFQQLQREESAQIYDATLLDVTLPLVDGLVERLEQGIDVADVGCGAGHAVNAMARAFPRSRFTGLDFSEEGIEIARGEARAWGLTNATFEVRDVATLDGSSTFDFITAFDTIHDQAQPRRVLQGIADSLRKDGVFLCVDIQADSAHAGNIAHPLGALLYTFSVFHCMTVSLALGGEGLGTMWGEQQARELLREAGFRSIDAAHVDGDMMNVYYVCRRA
jgi:SAM-dependent methyltransferase